jgi:hypothetical protein
MTTEVDYQESASDFTDAALIDAFLEVQRLCSDLGTAKLIVTRFNSFHAYDGSADAEKVNRSIFLDQRDQLGELRTIKNIRLVFGESPKDSLRIEFSRNESISIAFSAIGVKTAQDAARQAAQEANSTPRQPAAQKTAKVAAEQVSQTIAHQTPQLLNLIAATNKCGLIASQVHDDGIKPESAMAVRALAERIADLQTTIRSQTHTNESARRQLIQEYDSRTEQLRKEHQERSDRLKDDHKAWEEETRNRTTEKEQEIEQKAREVSEREKSIDFRTEREARRKLRDEFLEKAKAMFEKPDLSQEAKASFNKVETACKWTLGMATALLLIAFLAPPILEICGINLSSETILLTWSIRVLAGITLATTLIYYVSSLSAWSKQVSTIELRSKQFALDIDRASWLVETTLEYEKEGKALPSSLLESFSRGLFESGSSTSREQVSSPLLHLLHNLDSLKLGPAGAEMAMSGKQLRKADAEASKDA